MKTQTQNFINCPLDKNCSQTEAEMKLVAACLRKDEAAWGELISKFKPVCQIIARNYNISEHEF